MVELASPHIIMLHATDVRPTTFADWEKIDAVERSEGERRGKPREKVTSTERMLDIITQSRDL